MRAKVSLSPLSPGGDVTFLHSRTRVTHRFLILVMCELKRWFTSWTLWGWIVGFWIFTPLAVYSFQINVRQHSAGFSGRASLTAIFGVMIAFYSLGVLIFSSVMSARDFRSHFANTSRMLFTHTISYIGMKFLVISIVSVLYSFVLYGSYWIIVSFLWHKANLSFNPPVPWWHYIGTSTLLTLFLALCATSMGIIVEDWFASFLITYILVGGGGLLLLILQHTPHKYHATAYIFMEIMLNAVHSNPASVMINSPLTYWQNIGVATIYPLVFVVACVLVVLFWGNRRMPFSFSRQKRKDKK